MSNFLKVKEFMATFGQEVKTKSRFPNKDIVNLRIIVYVIYNYWCIVTFTFIVKFCFP